MDFQKIADAIEKSEPEIKKLLFSEEIGQFLQNLTQKYNLTEEETLQIIDEVGYIILKLKERQSLKISLVRIGIAKSLIPPIIMEVSKKIFSELDNIKTIDIQNQNVISTSKEVGIVRPMVKDKSMTPEIAPEIHPMIEKGEKAHSVPHQEPPPTRQDLASSNVTLPDYRYPGGKDPYREPTQ